MASRIKTFSLCEESYAIVMQKRNKSQHLRTLILEEDNSPRDQGQLVSKIRREALKLAAGILHTIEQRQLVQLLEYFVMDDEVNVWNEYRAWADEGRGVDWFIYRLEAMARDETV